MKTQGGWCQIPHPTLLDVACLYTSILVATKLFCGRLKRPEHFCHLARFYVGTNDTRITSREKGSDFRMGSTTLRPCLYQPNLTDPECNLTSWKVKNFWLQLVSNHSPASNAILRTAKQFGEQRCMTSQITAALETTVMIRLSAFFPTNAPFWMCFC